MDQETTPKISLQVILDGEVIFQSCGHWLFPLFDLEDYLNEHPVSPLKLKYAIRLLVKQLPSYFSGSVLFVCMVV